MASLGSVAPLEGPFKGKNIGWILTQAYDPQAPPLSLKRSEDHSDGTRPLTGHMAPHT